MMMRIRPLTVLLLALALAVASVGCSSGDGDEAQPATTSTDPASPEQTSPEEPSATAETIERPPRGNTRVGLITELPALDVVWERHTLDATQPPLREAFVTSVARVDGELVVVATGWSAEVENQVLYTWRSRDGEAWDVSTLEIPRGQHVYQVDATGDRLIALGSRSTTVAYVPRIFLWDPSTGWAETDLGTAGVDLEGVEIVGAASTDAGIVLGGRRDRYDAVPNIIDFELDGYRVEIDDGARTYQLSDAATGQLAASGRLDEIYHHSDEGQSVYGDDGELLTIVPWEVWEQQLADYPPLPLPLPDPGDRDGDPGVTVEWDGFEITRFEAEDRFEVRLASTGEVVASGSLVDLFRGPPPTFVDRDTDEVLIQVPWGEWYDLLGAAYQEVSEPHVAHPAQHLILFSPDGTTWREQLLEEGANTHLESVLALDGQFVVTVVEHVEFGAERTSYVSANGLNWTLERGLVDAPEYLHAADAGSTGAIALTDVNGSSAVAVSTDGMTWATGLFLPRQEDGRHGWLREVASGGLGRAVIGTIDPDPTADVLTVTVGSLTARFAGPDSALQVTDDSGAVLLDLNWDDLERSAQGTGPNYASYADGVTELRTADGTLLMSITNEQAREASEERSRRIEAGVDQVLFVEIDGQWYEAQLPEVDGAVPEQIAVGDDLIAVGVNAYTSVFDGDVVLGDGPIEVLVGRIEG